MSDPSDMATAGVIGTVGGFLSALGVQWLKGRTAGRQAAAEERQAIESRRAAEAAAAATVEVERVRVEPSLSQQLAGLHARIEEIHRQCEEDRRQDQAECERRMSQMEARHSRQLHQQRETIEQYVQIVTQLRVDLSEVASRAAGELRNSRPYGREDTAVRSLERIARRPPSDPQMRAVDDEDE